ncbi:MAG TPA: hypothetical protein DHV66_01070 [Raoultella ornithinolytica]|nr:hypothetical protein [Raoultella ornithinolytica]
MHLLTVVTVIIYPDLFALQKGDDAGPPGAYFGKWLGGAANLCATDLNAARRRPVWVRPHWESSSQANVQAT